MLRPYELYNELDWAISLGSSGDCYDRYLIRMNEMRTSLGLILNSLDLMKGVDNSVILSTIDSKYSLKSSKFSGKEYFTFDMELLINHFKNMSGHFLRLVERNSLYLSTETPKGEFGLTIDMSDSFSKPINRCKIKAPGFFHLQGLDYMCTSSYLADVVTNIGTLDIVFGEVDR